MKPKHSKKLILFPLVLTILVVFMTLILPGLQGMSESEALEAFKQYVLDPIPESVTNIRADQPKSVMGFRYTFRFDINGDDLALLIDSRPFVKVWNIEYDNGDLGWDWDRDGPLGVPEHRTWMLCYKRSARKPAWFKPGLWDNYEAYAFWKIGDFVNHQIFTKDSTRGPYEFRVILYNENINEAYYVVEKAER